MQARDNGPTCERQSKWALRFWCPDSRHSTYRCFYQVRQRFANEDVDPGNVDLVRVPTNILLRRVDGAIRQL